MPGDVQQYDCIVIGKGLIGSAAARYLKSSLNRVAIIGPDEPIHNLSKAQVFASHYDQSRVQRVIGIDPVWTLLNKKSTSHYPKLEAESGIQFHYAVGCLYVTPDGKDNYLKNLPNQANQFRLPYQFLENGVAINKAFPDYSFSDSAFGMLEQAPSGHINPLQLIQAQLHVFKKHNGDVYNDTVVKIDSVNNSYRIKTTEGRTFTSHQVLVTAGAFSNFFGLLPRPLDLELESETVLLAQVSSEEAERLSKLPSLLYEVETEKVEGIYLVQPVLYPDGAHYIKMGCNLNTDITFQNLEQIQSWFRHGDSESNISLLREALHSFMPKLDVLSYKTKKCIISRTKHKQCYIGPTERKNLFVAAGGNGYSAMCSDALGEIAAHFVLHENTPSDFSAQSFEPVVI
mgnify:CR=1 FL=1